MAGITHIVGAGIAGLAAAVALAHQGKQVRLYDAAGHAGGRCRSYLDQALGHRIDNGNHLILSGNRSVQRFLSLTGARDSFVELPPRFPFIDLRNEERWVLRLGRSPVPFWLFLRRSRVPHTHFWHYLRDLSALSRAAKADESTIFFRHSHPLGERLWEPLSVSILNTELETGSAKLLWQTFAESLTLGGRACQPLLPKEGLSESLIDPAIAFLERKGHRLHLNWRLREMSFGAAAISSLNFGSQQKIDIGPEDKIILAVPAPVAKDLIPEITAPEEFRPITNAHYLCDLPDRLYSFTGIVGGLSEWIFVKPGIVSVTISAASHTMDQDTDELAQVIWEEICTALKLGIAPMPAVRIVREKRATFAATAEQDKRRPETVTKWQNLMLAGDWVQTGLPATIEGAIRSGFSAAAALDTQKI